MSLQQLRYVVDIFAGGAEAGVVVTADEHYLFADVPHGNVIFC